MNKLAPEPIMRASLLVLHVAAYTTRNWSLSENVSRKQINDLWEAIHEIPDLLKRWDRSSESEAELKMYLREYDSKWKQPNLEGIYQQALAAAEGAESENVSSADHADFADKKSGRRRNKSNIKSMNPPISAAEFGIELWIDGTPTEPALVWAHHQDDPYPGGHHYRLALKGNAAKQLADSLPSSVSMRLDKAATGYFFNLYDGMFSLACRPQRSRWDFVLNTIDTAQVSEGLIVVEGVCSPFVR